MTALLPTQRKKRGREQWATFTHTPLLGRQLGRGWVIPNTELKERKHQLCGIFQMANEVRKQRKAFSKSLIFYIAASLERKAAAPRGRNPTPGEKAHPDRCLPQAPATTEGRCGGQRAVAAPVRSVALERCHRW